MSMGHMEPEQGEFWIVSGAIKTPGHPFFKKLNALLAQHDFDERVAALCRLYYAKSSGRPSIPPGRYFRMLMIWYFEDICSERGLAWRCEDSLSRKAFLGLGVADAAPDHSSRSVMRKRIPLDVFDAVNKLVLEILKDAGLLQARVLALDASRWMRLQRGGRLCGKTPMRVTRATWKGLRSRLESKLQIVRRRCHSTRTVKAAGLRMRTGLQ